jgi:hypothetical protein
MSRALHQPRADVGGLFGVVEDDQPATLAAQPPLGDRRRSRGGLLRCGPVRGNGQRTELIGDQLGTLGVDPPHQVVLAGEAVGVLGGQARFPDPAHPVQSLHHRGVGPAQLLPQPHDHRIASGECRIAQRKLAHRWQGPRQPWRRIRCPGPLARRKGGSPGRRTRSLHRFAEHPAGLLLADAEQVLIDQCA